MARRRSRSRKSTGDPVYILMAGAFLMAIAVVAAVLHAAVAHPVYGTLGLLTLAGTGGAVAKGRLDRRRQQRAVWAARAQQISAYRHMTPSEFERALAFLCERDGCRGVQVVGGAGDLGADVIATVPDGRRIVIQAKRYAPTNRVGSPEIQKVGGTYAVVHRAHLAAVVTTSSYTPAAVSYARQAGIRLLGETELAAWASRTGPAPWH
jgi:restriction system protein